MEPETVKSHYTCKVCQQVFQGNYCNTCGEKVLNPSEKSFRYFLGNILNAFTFIDSKFLKTLKLMVFKPGFVSSQVIEGIRVPFIKPVSMFFIVNLIYFLFATSDTYNSKLDSQLNRMPYSRIIKSIIEEKLIRENIALNDFRIRYENQSTSLAKLMLIVFVLFTGVFFLLLNLKKEFYFYDHLTVSLEFNALFILISNILLHYTALLIAKFMSLVDVSIWTYLTDSVFTAITVVIAVILLYSIHRRAYRNSVAWSLLKALVFIPCLAMSMVAYRAILFFVTIWTV